MKLLKYVNNEGTADEVLMVVPNSYDEGTADDEATDILGEGTYLEWSSTISLTASDWDAPAYYRPYVG